MQQSMTPAVFRKNAQIYRVMANPTRLHILNFIRSREATVGELTQVLGLRKANVSQHLALLRHLRLVKARRDGVNIYYRIANPKIVEPCRILRDLWSSKGIS